MVAATKKPKAKPADEAFTLEDDDAPMTDQEWDQCLKRLCSPNAADAVRWSEFAKVPQTDAAIESRLVTIWVKPVTVDSGRLQGHAQPVKNHGCEAPMVWMDQTHSKGTPALSGDELVDAVRRVWSIPKAAAREETPDELLALSLSLHPPLERMKQTGATDAELLAEIKAAWRTGHPESVLPYVTRINDSDWGCAIWISGYDGKAKWKDDTPPPVLGAPMWWALGAKADSLLVSKVRVVMGIEDKQFSEIKKKGKSVTKAPQASEDQPAELGQIVKFEIAKLFRSPYQTREEPSQAWLEELAETMRLDGQLQPCLIRPSGEIIAGHTRWQAAQLLKWTELDVRIVECDDATARRLVLLDNAKRKDLTDRERMRAYLDLLDDFQSRGRTQGELARSLGIGESTLSNIVRLRSIPEPLWERYEAGGLSIDQLRALATHAARPKYVEGVLAHLAPIEGQPELSHFRSAMQAGIERAFRPMGMNHYGQGCLFKPNKIEAEMLEIIEVESPWGDKQKMAANVQEWNRLQKAAKAERKRKQIAGESTADPKVLKATQEAETQQRLQTRVFRLDDAWHAARCAAIAERFKKPKKQDQLAAVRLRIWIAQQTGTWGDFVLDTAALTLADAEFMSSVCADVLAFFAESGEWRDVPEQHVKDFCDWLNLTPANYWKASTELLETCTPAELQVIANDFDLPEDQQANDLVEALVSKWPAGMISPLFRPEAPKAKSKKK